jgi:hypothetical protein
MVRWNAGRAAKERSGLGYAGRHPWSFFFCDTMQVYDYSEVRLLQGRREIHIAAFCVGWNTVCFRGGPMHAILHLNGDMHIDTNKWRPISNITLLL